MDGAVHGDAFCKACCKLVQVLHEQGEIGIQEMKKCLPEPKFKVLFDVIKNLRIGEDHLEYNDDRGYLPQHLGYVVTKVTVHHSDFYLSELHRTYRC